MRKGRNDQKNGGEKNREKKITSRMVVIHEEHELIIPVAGL